jgi:hypothetical protein
MTTLAIYWWSFRHEITIAVCFSFCFLLFGGKCVCRGRNCGLCRKKRLKIREVQIHVEVFCIINRTLERFNFISLDKYFSLCSANFPELCAVMYSC